MGIKHRIYFHPRGGKRPWKGGYCRVAEVRPFRGKWGVMVFGEPRSLHATAKEAVKAMRWDREPGCRRIDVLRFKGYEQDWDIGYEYPHKAWMFRGVKRSYRVKHGKLSYKQRRALAFWRFVYDEEWTQAQIRARSGRRAFGL